MTAEEKAEGGGVTAEEEASDPAATLVARLRWPADVVFRSAERRDADKADARAAELAFQQQVEALLASPEEAAHHGLLRVLIVVAHVNVKERSDGCPFWNQMTIDAIPQADLQTLTAVAQRVPNLAFRATLIDVAWYRRVARHTHVSAAIEAYLLHAEGCLDPAHWVPAYRALCRAVALAAAMGKRTPAFVAVLNRANEMALALGSSDGLYFGARVLSLLVDHKYPRREALRESVRLRAEAACAAGDYHRATDLLGFVHRCCHAAGNDADARAMAMRIADVHEEAARSARLKGEPMLAENFQMEAVKAWRSVGNVRERELAARATLQDIQRENVASLKEVRVAETDLTDCVNESIARVSGLDPLAAIRRLLALSRTADIAKVRTRVQERLKETVFYSLFGAQALSSAGRRVHRRGPVMVPGTGTEEEQKQAAEALDDEVRQDLAMGWQVLTVAGIIPALGQIQAEHNLGATWLWPYVLRSPFVPPGRHASFVRGLDLGLAGDFATAAHVLMPQFEAAVRRLLEQRGAVVSTLPSSEEQNELDLNKLLTLPEASELFGADQLFALQTLLTEKAGVNLRNELAHGLFDDGDRDQHLAYFWWTTLRLVMFPFMSDPPKNASAEEERKATPESVSESGPSGPPTDSEPDELRKEPQA